MYNFNSITISFPIVLITTHALQLHFMKQTFLIIE